MDFDKLDSKFSLNYFLEENNVVVKIPLKESNDRYINSIILSRFDISNKVYLTQIN